MLLKEFHKGYNFYIKIENVLVKKMNVHLCTQTNYSNYNLEELSKEMKSLTLTVFLTKSLNDFANDIMTALKKILKKFDKNFYKIYGIITPLFILKLLSKKNSPLEYMQQFKIIDQIGVIAENSANELKTTSNTFDDNAKATISINTTTGAATIVFQGSYTVNTIKYNKKYKLFSCYATTQQDVYIYRREPAATFDVTMGSAGWRTLICAQNVSVQDGYQAYTVTGSDASSVMLTNVATVKAGCPYLLSGPEGTCTLTVIDAAEEPEGNLLAVSTESDGNGVYVLANKSHGVGFYRWDGGLIGSGRVILPAAAVAGKSREFFGFDEGGTTSLCEVRGLKAEVRGEFYNLNGQRVAQPAKGLYIQNGRKVILK
jgi:hypothetical protein